MSSDSADDLSWMLDPAQSEAILKEHQKILDRWIDLNINRNKTLAQECPYCPRCGTRQVQLTSNKKPAQWKCLECKRQFEYEPE